MASHVLGKTEWHISKGKIQPDLLYIGDQFQDDFENHKCLIVLQLICFSCYKF